MASNHQWEVTNMGWTTSGGGSWTNPSQVNIGGHMTDFNSIGKPNISAPQNSQQSNPPFNPAQATQPSNPGQGYTPSGYAATDNAGQTQQPQIPQVVNGWIQPTNNTASQQPTPSGYADNAGPTQPSPTQLQPANNTSNNNILPSNWSGYKYDPRQGFNQEIMSNKFNDAQSTALPANWAGTNTYQQGMANHYTQGQQLTSQQIADYANWQNQYMTQ